MRLMPGHTTTSLDLDISTPESTPTRPAFQLLNEKGELNSAATEKFPDLDLSKEKLLHMYKLMVKLQVMDGLLYEVQRQGRISFYMSSSGEEGLNIGAGMALSHKDHITAQYREQGVLLCRGFTMLDCIDQCFATCDDKGKGRQMPVHYGSRAHNFHTISSPLATQLPQAVGQAYALKGQDAIACCFFGEGAASEGDASVAFNFAATLESPILFFCRNNGYAISTPVHEQMRGDGVISRAPGFGLASVRVDGNDPLAVNYAVTKAREFILKNQRPVLLEAMTYRQGHHSTSDDSTRYRSIDEIELWRTSSHPITRLFTLLKERGYWSDKEDQELRKVERKAVMDGVKKAEKKERLHAMDHLFSDVYYEKPVHLVKQERELAEHLKKYPDSYGDAH